MSQPLYPLVNKQLKVDHRKLLRQFNRLIRHKYEFEAK